MLRILFLFLLAISTSTYAGFFCPDDITISCDMDVHNTDMTGYPSTTGINTLYPIKYIDESTTNGCNVGTVYRSWYQDLNNNNIIDGADPVCVQEITLDYLEYDLYQINYPPNRDLDCIDDISFEAPEIVNGPCDLVGYVYEDQVFHLTSDACYKVLRTFTVINWCLYDENDPTPEGIESYTQVIKVTEKELPEITSCEDITIGVGANCMAEVTFSATANDTGNCPSEELYWTISVDIGWDLVSDYEYSYYLTGDQFIDATANGESIEITLPDLIPIGTHGVSYTVRDGCGNIRACDQRIYVKDLKPPTPYCHSFLTAAFDADAMPAMIPARLFDLGASDNCTTTENIHISFSPDINDTIKVITCGNQGFQFFNIYVTDDAGNQDFCEVFMLIFDNDGCSFRHSPHGRITDVYGEPISNVEIALGIDTQMSYTTSSVEGKFVFEDMALHSDYMFKVMQEGEAEEVGLLELEKLQNYLLGNTDYTQAYQYIASDLNRDHKVNVQDVMSLRSHLLGIETLPIEALHTYYEAESVSESWQDYQSEVPYIDYNGNLDFVAVSLSDIIEVDQELHTIDISSQKTILADRHTIEYTLDEGINVSGMLIKIQAPGLNSIDEVAISSSYYNVKSQDVYLDNDTEMISILLHADKEIPIGSQILHLESLIPEVDFHITSWTTLQNGQLYKARVTDRSKNIVEEVELIGFMDHYIEHNQLMIHPPYQDGTLRVYDLAGNIVIDAQSPSRIDISQLHAGMYIATWTDGQQLLSEKFVKD